MNKIAIIGLSLILALVVGSVGCGQATNKYTPPPDMPLYTADQVIFVAMANPPYCWWSDAVPNYSVSYLGLGRWRVDVEWNRGHSTFERDTGYFYENTGNLIWK